MNNIIVGTAGHIDHGKTTLVRTLTGIDTDRLEEEKRRGITIDLGFAHLQLTPAIRLGFVDVPGHERFVRNMLAGVGGIDLVLFVIAADEWIKPQTREHFDICRLLGIRHGIIALTKSDLVEGEMLELAKLEVEEFVAGSFLENAPIVPVSATTGAGLEELRRALVEVAARIGKREASSPARMPVDRSFTMRGFGTVVTGTLLSGRITVDQELELMPVGRELRVRGIQVYGRTAREAEAGMRTAVNLADIEASEIQRGMVLAERGSFEPTRVFDCTLELLRSARRLKHRAPVHFHSGTAEIEAEVRFFKKALVEPGAKTFARIALKEPAVVAPGDRFILRQFSPVITIAGGCILDVQPTRERKVARIEERLRVLAGDDAVAKAALLIDESGGGLSLDRLAVRLALSRTAALGLAREAGALVVEPPGWVVSRSWMQRVRAGLVQAIQQFHLSAPLAPGMFRHDLKTQCAPDAPPFLFDTLLSGAPELVAEGDRVRHRAHRLVLRSDEEAARRSIESAFEKAGASVPAVAEVLAQAGVDQQRGRAILQLLLKEQVLIRVNDEMIFHRSAIEQMKTLLVSRRDQNFTVSLFKEWTGISRKYALPLLEFFDRERVTVRNGDLRRVV